VIELHDVTKTYGRQDTYRQIEHLMVRGNDLGLSDQTEVEVYALKYLSGKVEPTSGSVEIGETVKIGYYTQSDDRWTENYGLSII